MKKFIYSLAVMMSALAFTSCSDFFDPDTDDELNGTDYISSDTEMYTGFLGIMTKLQAIGDKQILLTEPRGEVVEITSQSTADLIQLYNYVEDLTGNPYANPAGYYEVVIACNDYIAKMKEYRKMSGVDPDVWAALLSSTIRVKAWTYKTIAEIYGEAVWFDDPIDRYVEISASNGFELLPVGEVMSRALQLMDTGVDGVPSNLSLDWYEALDPTHSVELASSPFRWWNTMTPAYEGLYAELCLWKGAYIESRYPGAPAGAPEAAPYYKTACDLILKVIDDAQLAHNGSTYYLPSSQNGSGYKTIYERATPYERECISALIYDSANNQLNTLLKHFSDEYPNLYLLRPSEVGKARFLDPDFNPGVLDSDNRCDMDFRSRNGVPYVSKFRSHTSTIRKSHEDDVHIYLYRATMYHLMLAEALNHLKRFEAMDGVLNRGVNVNNFVADTPEWEGFTRNWTADASWGTAKYNSSGIRGMHGLGSRPIHEVTSTPALELFTYKANDMQILDEAMLEFSCEGKVYPIMNRMALRYGDPSLIADRVCPKYESVGTDALIRARIEAGGHWVHYDLQLIGQTQDDPADD